MAGGELTREDYLRSLKELVGKKWYETDDNRKIFITIDKSHYDQPWLVTISQEGSPPRNDLIVRGLPYDFCSVWFRGREIRSIDKAKRLTQLARNYARIS